jgi:hypothetical protein
MLPAAREIFSGALFGVLLMESQSIPSRHRRIRLWRLLGGVGAINGSR